MEDKLRFLQQAYSNNEIFLINHVIKLSDGNEVVFPDWNLPSVFPHQAHTEAPDHGFNNYIHSLKSSRSSSPDSASESGDCEQRDSITKELCCRTWTLPTSGNDERKYSLCKIGECIFGSVLIVSPALLRGDSESYDRVVKILAKPRSFDLMLEFLKDSDFSDVIRAAVIKGAQGVAFIMEFDTSGALQALKEILEENYADLDKNTQISQLNPETFLATGPLYKATKLAYANYGVKNAILQLEFGEEVLAHTLGKFGKRNLRQLDWQGFERSFGNQHAQSVAERHSAEDLMEMTDLFNKLKFRLQLLEDGNDFQMIQQVLSNYVNNLTYLHRVVAHFKECFAIDPTALKRKEVMENCKKEIAKYKQNVENYRKKGHVRTNEQRLAKLQKEEADCNRKAKEKSKSFLKKNSLDDYEVLHLESEYNDEALAAFDEAILAKEDGERERVYHILMAEIEKSKSDESVTQSKTEKKKVSTFPAKQRKRYRQSPRKNSRRNKQF